MAKKKHPKLKWSVRDEGDRVGGPFTIVQSAVYPGLWKVYRLGRSALGLGRTIGEAKAIAQAFADSETLRGEE